MEKFTVENDIRVLCVPAKSFPDGVLEAFQTLEKISTNNKMPFFGISYLNEKGNIIYKAAAQESYEGEAIEKGCETFIIKKGGYLTETIKDFRKKESEIGKCFERLLHSKGTDTRYPCVEWYDNTRDVKCMVKIL